MVVGTVEATRVSSTRVGVIAVYDVAGGVSVDGALGEVIVSVVVHGTAWSVPALLDSVRA